MSLRNVAILSAAIVVFAGAGRPVLAQHEGHTMPGMSDTTKKKPAAKPKAKPSKAPPKRTTAKPGAAKRSKIRPSVVPKPDSMSPLVPVAAAVPGTSRVHSGHDMTSGPLSLSMDRMGSGTTWIPDAVT
jgi:hypothetical protein